MRRASRTLAAIMMICHILLAPTAMALEEDTALSEPPVPNEATVQLSQLTEDLPASLPAAEPPAPVLRVLDDTPPPGEEEPPLVLPPLLINRVVVALPGKSAYEYIELHNPNPHDIFIDSWRVVIMRSNLGGVEKDKREFIIHGTVTANGYVLIGGKDVDAPDPEFQLSATPGLVAPGGIVQLIDAAGVIVEQLRWGDASHQLGTYDALERRYSDDVPHLTGDPLLDFERKPANVLAPPRAGGYVPYVAPVNRCQGVLISEIAANVAADRQFIELYNASAGAVVLDECLLQINRSTTKNFVLSGTLQPGEYRAVYVAQTGLTLTKTTAGTVYLLSSDGQEEIAVSSYEGLATGTSWSWFGPGDWRQTFSLTPGAANNWQEFLPCDAGYERNAETGRCRKIITEEAPVDCGPGKYRSVETNRCRAVETANPLMPCQEGQYRSPDTNRCRSVATAAAALAPCKEGQERNPDTNRCRNVVASVPESAFAVEPFAETGKAFAGWWALGGLGVLAAGRGAWEWRGEMLAGIRKIGSFFTSGK